MKRSEQLKKLSREHHNSLSMAVRITRIVDKGSDADIVEAIDTVKAYYNDELEEHFQHEEQTIFVHIFTQYREHIGMATSLLKEHGYLRILAQRMTPESAKGDLLGFADVLKNHTRVEERELFPIIQELFTDEQMDAVLNFTPIH